MEKYAMQSILPRAGTRWLKEPKRNLQRQRHCVIEEFKIRHAKYIKDHLIGHLITTCFITTSVWIFFREFIMSSTSDSEIEVLLGEDWPIGPQAGFLKSFELLCISSEFITKADLNAISDRIRRAVAAFEKWPKNSDVERFEICWEQGINFEIVRKPCLFCR